MIVLEKKSSATDAVIWTEEPTIYMDNWALNRFSADQALKQQFLAAFQSRGTLLISVMLAVEVGANASPARPELRAFLDAIGPYWVPLTIDAWAVINAQERHGGKPDACISSAFIEDPQFSAKLHGGSLSLAAVVDLTRGPDGFALKAATDASTARMTADIALHRADFQADPKALDRKWPAIPWDAIRYMRPIYNQFMRLTVRGRFNFTDNHARDMFHSIASVGCAHMTLLDGHWAELARQVQKQLGFPSDFVRIYSPDDLPAFLADLGVAPKTRGAPRPNI